MKNELNNMLSLSQQPKKLRINGMFALYSWSVDKYGVAITAPSDREPAQLRLELRYELKLDKFYMTSKTLESRTIDGLLQEIPETMAAILDEINETLIKSFKNGQLLGNVEND